MVAAALLYSGMFAVALADPEPAESAPPADLVLYRAVSRGVAARDTAAQVGYLNQAHRWNWGIVGGQIPYLSGGFQTGFFQTATGESIQLDQAIVYRQTERSAVGMAAYPFNRSQRVEFTGGVTQLSFDQIVQTTAYSLNTGQLLNAKERVALESAVQQKTKAS